MAAAATGSVSVQVAAEACFAKRYRDRDEDGEGAEQDQRQDHEPLLLLPLDRPVADRPAPRPRAALPLTPADRLPVSFENASSTRPASLSTAPSTLFRLADLAIALLRSVEPTVRDRARGGPVMGPPLVFLARYLVGGVVMVVSALPSVRWPRAHSTSRLI